ncbi:MAG: hypothetical protein LBV10_06505 [Stenotrophomonas sp.]|jgi:hypothetical protein|uniref:hypothetical protein n=1 Tax=Stenotrophomonas sp. TaxID=69392 RepID=UPI00283F2816|nr:hypothetical protein [Stenotrophomonas sp.]MDR2959181.1 hypothetical protein [Stenotrophomonas sp.]
MEMSNGSAQRQALDEDQLEAWAFHAFDLVSRLRKGALERTLISDALSGQEGIGRPLKGNLGLVNFAARRFGDRLILSDVVGPSSRALARMIKVARRELEFDVLTCTRRGRLNVLRRGNDLEPESWLSSVPQLTAPRFRPRFQQAFRRPTRRLDSPRAAARSRIAQKRSEELRSEKVYHDSEFLLLNYFDLAMRRLYRFSFWRRIEGVVYLFTERRPCEDCCHVITRLLRRYRRVQIAIVRVTGQGGREWGALEQLSEHPRVHMRKFEFLPLAVEEFSPLEESGMGPWTLPHPDGTPRRGWVPKGATQR